MKRAAIILFIFLGLLASAQPYSIHIEPMTVANFGGVQSFAVGKSNGKWLIIGGRLDGLHQRQPFASFDAAGHNDQLFVIDPTTGTTWSSSLTSLPNAIQMQLKSTNMEFTQVDSMLYVIGGYGMNSSGSHVTFDQLTAINIPQVISAVVNGQSLSPHIRQISNSDFKVTGGQLYRIHDVFYLVGGQSFDGRYNPHGPNHGPGFTQQYTNAVRRFTLQDDGTNLSVQFLSEYSDANLLHRRDYNAVPTIDNGEEGIIALSGVFQHTADLPWTNAVTIDSSGFSEVAGFTQYYNHYHSAKSVFHDPSNNHMHFYIYGGIAQYFLQNGSRVQDNNVPFVKTIAYIERDASGTLTETPLTAQMPDYLGAGAEFIPLDGIAHFDNDIIDFSTLSGDSILIGHIVGGIKSTAPNIFFVNTGAESEATSSIYKVYLVANTVGIQESTPQPRVVIRPNPSSDVIHIDITDGNEIHELLWIDQTGRSLETRIASSSKDSMVLHVDDLPRGVYTLKMEFEDGTVESYKLAIR